MKIEINKNPQVERVAQSEEQAQTIHGILHRKKTPQEREAFEARIKTIFERYDQTFRNLANERSGES